MDTLVRWIDVVVESNLFIVFVVLFACFYDSRRDWLVNRDEGRIKWLWTDLFHRTKWLSFYPPLTVLWWYVDGIWWKIVLILLSIITWKGSLWLKAGKPVWIKSGWIFRTWSLLKKLFKKERS